MRLRGIFLGFFLVTTVGAASAQTAIYAEFSAAQSDAQVNDWIYGPTVGLYHDTGHHVVALGEDVRGTFLNHNGVQIDSGLIGGRVVVTPHVLPIKPDVEALAGVGRYSANSTATMDFEYQFLGGVDFTFFPRVDWRVAEFSYGGISVLNGSYNPKTVSMGLVFRLP